MSDVPRTDPRIDSYISRQADFARPILLHLRRAVHAACPEAEETVKWGMPTFMYKGQILATMAAFKAHATFGFRLGSEVVGETERQRTAMGQFGRLTSVEDLPNAETLTELIRKAMELTEAGGKPARSKTAKPEIEMPGDLQAALDFNPAASATYSGFPPSCRREYLEWIVEAKRPETRSKRVAQAVEWLAEGKRRNWKYENC
jgi:uncharacterized protein YdeI (YjbR/CyaY-like superfamily)